MKQFISKIFFFSSLIAFIFIITAIHFPQILSAEETAASQIDLTGETEASQAEPAEDTKPPQTEPAEETGRMTELLLFSEFPISIASKYKQKASEAPSIVTVITGDMIKQMGARNLEDILRTIAGFDIVQFATHKDIQIGIRGLASTSDNNKVKIMLNGHSLRAFNSAPAFYLNFIPVEDVDRIEIIRGPGAALYGTNAFLGVINIITKTTMEKTVHAAVRGGSLNTMKPNLEVAFQGDDDLKLYLYSEYFRTDGPKLLVEEDNATKNFPPGRSAAPGNTASNAQDTSLQANLSYKNLTFTGFYHHQLSNTHIGLSRALTDETEINIDALFAELGYTLPLSGQSNLSLKTYYDAHVYDALYEIFSEETAEFFSTIRPTAYPEGEGIHSGPYGVYSIIGGEVNFDQQFTEGFHLLAGMSYEYIDWSNIKHMLNGNVIGRPLIIDGTTYASLQYVGSLRDVSDIANWSDPATRNILAIFGQTTLKLNKLLSLESFGENLALTAGVRYDNYDDIGSSVNPRAGLVYGPTQELNFKLLYGTAFRAPSFREMYNKNNPSFTGNPDIKPEKISTLEAYIGYKLTDNLETNLTYFNSRIEDLLAIITTTAGVIHHDNFGSLTSNGLEFEFKGSWGKNKYGYINATYQNAKNTTHATITDSTGRTYTQEDFNPGSIADIIGNVGINYDFTENIMANLSLNYMGERKRSGEKTFDSNDNLVVIDQRDPLPSLILLNACLTLGHFDFLKDLEMQLAVFNILDQDHRDPDGSGIITYDIPREGRSYMGKISYGF